MEIRIHKAQGGIFNLYVSGEYHLTVIGKEGVIREITKMVEKL